MRANGKMENTMAKEFLHIAMGALILVVLWMI